MKKIIDMGEILTKIRVKRSDDVYLIDGSCAKTIADMQRDIDAYHTAFANITGYLGGKFGERRMPTIMCELAASEYVNNDIDMIFDAAIQLRKEYEKLLKEAHRKITV